jgi:hypothetical protein
VTLGPQREAEEIGMARIARRALARAPERLGGARDVAAGQVGDAQQPVGGGEVGMGGDQRVEILQRRPHRAGLDVHLGEEQDRVDEIGRDDRRLLGLDPRLLEIPGLPVRERQLVARRRLAGLGAEQRLEVLDRAGRVAAGEPDASPDEHGLAVRGAQAERAVERLQRRVVPSLRELELGQTPPRRDRLGTLLDDLRQCPARVLGPPLGDVELREPHPRGRPARRQVRGPAELALGRRGIAAGHVETAERRVRLDEGGIARKRVMEGALGGGEITLLGVDETEGEVKSRARGEPRPRGLERAQRGRGLGRAVRGVGEEGQRVQVRGIELEDAAGVLARLGPPAADQVERAEPHAARGVTGIQLPGPVQEGKRARRLPELVVREPETAQRADVLGLQLEHVAVLDDGLAEGAPRDVALGALEMPRLLRLRRPRAPVHRREREQRQEQEASATGDAGRAAHRGRRSASTGASACTYVTNRWVVAATSPRTGADTRTSAPSVRLSSIALRMSSRRASSSPAMARPRAWYQ